MKTQDALNSLYAASRSANLPAQTHDLLKASYDILNLILNPKPAGNQTIVPKDKK